MRRVMLRRPAGCFEVALFVENLAFNFEVFSRRALVVGGRGERKTEQASCTELAIGCTWPVFTEERLDQGACSPAQLGLVRRFQAAYPLV